MIRLTPDGDLSYIANCVFLSSEYVSIEDLHYFVSAELIDP